MNGRTTSGDEPVPPPPPAPDVVEPVDIAEFGRLTSAPPGAQHPDHGRHAEQRPAEGAISADPQPPADLPPPPQTEPQSPQPPFEPPLEEGPPGQDVPAWYGASAVDQPPPAWGYSDVPEDARDAEPSSGEEQPGMRPAAMTGPVGKHRSALAVAVLCLVTLGLYTIIWHARVNREMSDFHFGLDVHPRRTAVAIAVSWLIGLAVTVAGGARIAVHLAQVSLPFDPQMTPEQGALLLPAVLVAPILYALLPFSLVAAVMTIERVRLVEAHSGLPTDQQVRPSSLVWCLLIPLIGAPVLLAREQNRLNASWSRAAPGATAPGWGYDYGR